MTEEHDETIERIAAGLRPMPEVRPEAKARLLVAVAAERERDRDATRQARRVRGVLRWAGAAAVAAALAIAAFQLGHERGSGASAAIATDAAAAAPSMTLASRGLERAEPLQTVQLVFRAPAARRVSVVGDFTGWEPGRAPMTRDAASGLWSVSLSVTPGRHVYAFLVDDSVWVRDPRAPAAPDEDFGRPGSVLLVGRP